MPVLAHGMQRTGSISIPFRRANCSTRSDRSFDFSRRLRIIGSGRGGNAVLRCLDWFFDELLLVRVIIGGRSSVVVCAVNVMQTNYTLNGNEYEETDQRLEEEAEKGVWVWGVAVNNLV